MDAVTHDRLQDAVHRVQGRETGYDPLMNVIGNAHVVLLGEASHGTHEFYHERARITRRLIAEKDQRIVEPDLPETFPTGM